MTWDEKRYQLEQQFKVEESSNVPYFLNKPSHPVGSVYDTNKTALPKLFTPLKIKSTEFANRSGVSPMCTYSADHRPEKAGQLTQFHNIHYGSFALRGPGLIIVEASSVTPEGRLSPGDSGFWNEEQALKLKEIVDFVHAQGGKIGIQLGHGGRKSSGTPPFKHVQFGISSKLQGWSDIPGKIVAPSAIPFDEDETFYVTPHELTIEEISKLVDDFKLAAKRAYEISGVDFVEIHAAHGYLISTFLSSTSNKRTDKYGGSFENRVRFLLEIIDAVKDDKHPLFVRISASENSESIPESWKIEDSIKLADLLIEHGVDVLDASAGGITSKQDRRKRGLGFQVELAQAIKEHVGDKLSVATVGKLGDGVYANEVLEKGYADIILNGSAYLKNPGLTWKFADDLGVELNQTPQYSWPFRLPPFELKL